MKDIFPPPLFSWRFMSFCRHILSSVWVTSSVYVSCIPSSLPSLQEWYPTRAPLLLYHESPIFRTLSLFVVLYLSLSLPLQRQYQVINLEESGTERDVSGTGRREGRGGGGRQKRTFWRLNRRTHNMTRFCTFACEVFMEMHSRFFFFLSISRLCLSHDSHSMFTRVQRYSLSLCSVVLNDSWCWHISLSIQKGCINGRVKLFQKRQNQEDFSSSLLLSIFSCLMFTLHVLHFLLFHDQHRDLLLCCSFRRITFTSSPENEWKRDRG